MMARVLFLLVAFLFAMSACSSLPGAAKGAGERIRESLFQEPQFQLQNLPEIQDADLKAYLHRILGRMTTAGEAPSPVLVWDTEIAQAMVGEGNVIQLTKGMLFAVGNEAELIALLGHEVGHIRLGHMTSAEGADSNLIGEAIDRVAGEAIPGALRRGVERVIAAQFSQQREQQADEFGALLASRLGYDPSALADLFERLARNADAQSSRSVTAAGVSHRTLAKRAMDLRTFLRGKNIPPGGKLATASYLKGVRSLAAKLPSLSPVDQDLESLRRDLAGKGRRLTVPEFLSAMERLRSIAQAAGLLRQIDPRAESLDADETSDEFMMELIRVARPLWESGDPTLVKMRQVLSMLARMGVGAIPVVGDAVDLYEVLTGRDFYSDDPLSYGERVASMLGVFANSGKFWRQAGTELEIIGEESKNGISEAVREAQEAVENGPLSPGKKPMLGSSGQVDPKAAKEAQSTYRRIQKAENIPVLQDLAEEMRTKKFPEDWRYKVTWDGKASQGWEVVHPENPHIRVRVMPGDPKSEFPNSRVPNVRQTAHGEHIDRIGDPVGRKTNEAHIPLKDYKFWEFWRKDDEI